MPARITLEILENSVENVNGVPAAKLVLRTSTPVDVPDSSWFVVRRDSGVDSLVCVASVADFTNLPIIAPQDANPLRYWRTNEITYYTDIPDNLVEMIDNTKRRIQAAIDAFNAIAACPPTQTIIFS